MLTPTKTEFSGIKNYAHREYICLQLNQSAFINICFLPCKTFFKYIRTFILEDRKT